MDDIKKSKVIKCRIQNKKKDIATLPNVKMINNLILDKLSLLNYYIV